MKVEHAITNCNVFFPLPIIEDQFYNFLFLFRRERFVLFHSEAKRVHDKDVIEVKNIISYHPSHLSLCKQQECDI